MGMIKTAGELNDYLISLCEAEQPSVDRIIAGDKNTVIIKAGTCWMPYLETLQKAYEKGVNVMVQNCVYLFTTLQERGYRRHMRKIPEIH